MASDCLRVATSRHPIIGLAVQVSLLQISMLYRLDIQRALSAILINLLYMPIGPHYLYYYPFKPLASRSDIRLASWQWPPKSGGRTASFSRLLLRAMPFSSIMHQKRTRLPLKSKAVKCDRQTLGFP